MTEPGLRIACILLGAGLSSRFGSDKLLAELDGVPVAVHALRLYGNLPFSEKILVTRSGREVLAEEALRNGFSVYLNPSPEEGISKSIRTGLDAVATAKPQPDGILFGVCDQPGLTAGSVQRILDAFQSNPRCIVALDSGGEPGNPVLFPAFLTSELNALRGDRGGKAVVRFHPELLTLIPPAARSETVDIDRPEDLLSARKARSAE